MNVYKPSSLKVSYELTLLAENADHDIIDQIYNKLKEPIFIDQDNGMQTKIWLETIEMNININIEKAIQNVFLIFAEYNSCKKLEEKDYDCIEKGKCEVLHREPIYPEKKNPYILNHPQYMVGKTICSVFTELECITICFTDGTTIKIKQKGEWLNEFVKKDINLNYAEDIELSLSPTEK